MVDGEEVRARPEDCHSLGRRWRGSLRSAVAGRSAVISGDEGCISRRSVLALWLAATVSAITVHMWPDALR